TDAPVSRGAEGPLIQELMTAADTHGPGGLGHAALPPSGRIEDPRSGAQLWVDAARQQPGELVGLVLGPHTNLALALEIEPELPPRVLAAFSAAPRRPVLGPLEATETLRFEQAELERARQLAERSGHPVAAILADGLRWYFEFHEADGLGWMAHVHDPIVAI